MTYHVKVLTDERSEWDRFVDETPSATFFHLLGWRKVLEDSFGHRPHYFYVERDDRICGILPLFHIRSRLFGNRLASLPFCVAGGPVCDSAEIEGFLDRKAIGLHGDLKTNYIEYRNTDNDREGWVRKSDLYANFSADMELDADNQLKKVPRKQRAVLRKALKNDELSWTIDPDPTDLYALYAFSVRNLGTPVFPKRYFSNLVDQFGDACQILTVRHQGQPVSSVMSFYFRDRVMPYYTGSRTEARSLGANDLMYWHVMRCAAERGVRTFDFGRSKIGTGPYNFKKNWGFAPEPITHQYYLRDGHGLPNVNPANPKYGAFIAVWRSLPLPIANKIGPYLVRGTG